METKNLEIEQKIVIEGFYSAIEYTRNEINSPNGDRILRIPILMNIAKNCYGNIYNENKKETMLQDLNGLERELQMEETN